MGTTTRSGELWRPTVLEVPFADCWITEQAQQAALDALRSGRVGSGEQVAAFEREIAECVGAPQAVALSSSTSGVRLALRSLELEPGSRVLVSTMTSSDTVHAIVHAGLQPVLVDVDPLIGLPDECAVRRAAVACGGVDAMLVVHLAGDPAPARLLAAAAGLPMDRVVEDAAQALGAYHGTHHVGAGSAAACYSFHGATNLPIGGGGVVTTADPRRADLLRRLRVHREAGMTDLQAAVGRTQLRRLAHWQLRRAEVAARYDERLGALPDIGLPHRPRHGQGLHAWHSYSIRIPDCWPDRDEVAGALAAAGVGTSVPLPPVHRLGHVRGHVLGRRRDLAGAEALFPALLSLPMYPRLTDEQVDAVCNALDATLPNRAPVPPGPATGETLTSHVHVARPDVRVLDNTGCPPTVFDDASLLPADRDVLTVLHRQVGGADLIAQRGLGAVPGIPAANGLP